MLGIDQAVLILRVLVGLLFFGHGTQKLFGWFGGRGLSGTAGFFSTLGLRPARFWAVVAGLAETLGGLGLALGFYTPVAAALIVGVMLMAILKVHIHNGIWVASQGVEYPLVNTAIALIIGWLGAGQYSLDSVLEIEYPMPLTYEVALAAVILGVIIGLLTGIGQRQPQPEAQQA